MDAAQSEQVGVPVYYLHFHRLIQRVLATAGIHLSDVEHVIYSNLSASDRAGFVRAMGLAPAKNRKTAMADYGHTFASDLVINYCDLVREGAVVARAVAALRVGGDWIHLGCHACESMTVRLCCCTTG